MWPGCSPIYLLLVPSGSASNWDGYCELADGRIGSATIEAVTGKIESSPQLLGSPWPQPQPSVSLPNSLDLGCIAHAFNMSATLTPPGSPTYAEAAELFRSMKVPPAFGPPNTQNRIGPLTEAQHIQVTDVQPVVIRAPSMELRGGQYVVTGPPREQSVLTEQQKCMLGKEGWLLEFEYQMPAGISPNQTRFRAFVRREWLKQKNLEVTDYYSKPTDSLVAESADRLLARLAANISVSEAVTRLPEEFQQLYEEAQGKVGTLTEVLGGQCVVAGYCPAKFVCVGCAGNVPDPARRASVEQKMSWALEQADVTTREGLPLEAERMRQLARDCAVMLREMDQIDAYRRDEQRAAFVSIDSIH